MLAENNRINLKFLLLKYILHLSRFCGVGLILYMLSVAGSDSEVVLNLGVLFINRINLTVRWIHKLVFN